MLTSLKNFTNENENEFENINDEYQKSPNYINQYMKNNDNFE